MNRQYRSNILCQNDPKLFDKGKHTEAHQQREKEIEEIYELQVTIVWKNFFLNTAWQIIKLIGFDTQVWIRVKSVSLNWFSLYNNHLISAHLFLTLIFHQTVSVSLSFCLPVLLSVFFSFSFLISHKTFSASDFLALSLFFNQRHCKKSASILFFHNSKMSLTISFLTFLPSRHIFWTHYHAIVSSCTDVGY